MEKRKLPARRDERIIIHLDYDCFYASVFEAENPSLKSLPFAVQQKQIIVTCNYEARRRGLYKLQLVKDAKRICPEVIIELGEDISRFRDASKELYNFISAFSWSGRIERLGFDEVWLDVTDVVAYNVEILNRNDLSHSFFQAKRDDPTDGFNLDASVIAGHVYPKNTPHDLSHDSTESDISLKLCLGSHFALHIRHQLELQKGYTSTVGISTSKLISKLVGNLNKPKGQTTMMPPLDMIGDQSSNIIAFMDSHEIGKIPGIGFKLAQKLRHFILQRPPDFETGLVYGGTRESVTVASVRNHADVNPDMLEKLLGGPGSPHGIGYRVWCLLHGVDDTEVSKAKAVPSQISIEDSYIRLDTIQEVSKELEKLAVSLIDRMRLDLLGDDEFEEATSESSDIDGVVTGFPKPTTKKWLAHPKTLRLTTRPRLPLLPDGTRPRSFKRISHSAALPNFVFHLQENVGPLAHKLVRDVLLSMFRKLHPEKSGWNLSLVNLGVTNMAEAAGASKTANGRDIGHMFRRQESVLRDFKVVDPVSEEQSPIESDRDPVTGLSEPTEDNDWDEDVDAEEGREHCQVCVVTMPSFAMTAHRRFHSPPTG